MNLSDLIERFSDDAKRVLDTALSLAEEWGHTYIGTEHLLIGIVSRRESAPSRLLTERGVTESELRRSIVNIAEPVVRSSVTVEDLTPACRRILMSASLIARDGEQTALIGPEHLLMALLQDNNCIGGRMVWNCVADTVELLDALEKL